MGIANAQTSETARPHRHAQYAIEHPLILTPRQRRESSNKHTYPSGFSLRDSRRVAPREALEAVVVVRNAELDVRARARLPH